MNQILPPDNSLTLLGVGTCNLVPGQVTTSAVIRKNGRSIVFDMGRGVSNALAAYGFKQDDILDIVLSHFHPDHLSDLIPYLHAAAWSRIDARSQNLIIHGPYGTRVQIMRLLSLFGPESLSQPHYTVEINEVTSPTFSMGQDTYTFSSLPPSGNHGLQFVGGNKTYALTGDAQSLDELIPFLEGVDVAVIDSGHLTDETIVELAVGCNSHNIVCSHLYRVIDAEGLTNRARIGGYTGTITVAQQGMQWRW